MSKTTTDELRKAREVLALTATDAWRTALSLAGFRWGDRERTSMCVLYDNAGALFGYVVENDAWPPPNWCAYLIEGGKCSTLFESREQARAALEHRGLADCLLRRRSA